MWGLTLSWSETLAGENLLKPKETRVSILFWKRKKKSVCKAYSTSDCACIWCAFVGEFIQVTVYCFEVTQTYSCFCQRDVCSWWPTTIIPCMIQCLDHSQIINKEYICCSWERLFNHIIPQKHSRDQSTTHCCRNPTVNSQHSHSYH